MDYVLQPETRKQVSGVRSKVPLLHLKLRSEALNPRGHTDPNPLKPHRRVAGSASSSSASRMAAPALACPAPHASPLALDLPKVTVNMFMSQALTASWSLRVLDRGRGRAMGLSHKFIQIKALGANPFRGYIFIFQKGLSPSGEAKLLTYNELRLVYVEQDPHG